MLGDPAKDDDPNSLALIDSIRNTCELVESA